MKRAWAANNNDGAVFAPVQVAQLAGVTQISAGASHTCARKDNGSIVCWGRNDIGQLGSPDGELENPSIPNLVPGIPPMQAISSGDLFNCALTMDGKRWCWGDSLVDGGGLEVTTPQLIQAPYNIMTISAGGSHVCDIVGDWAYREVYCTGENQRGQLGNGHADAWAIPQRIDLGGIFSDHFEE